MTWAAGTLGTAVSRTGVFLKRQLWIWPIIATVLLASLGFVVNRSIAATMKANLRSQLITLVSVETEMLQNWMRDNMATAASLANSQPVRESVYELIRGQEKTAAGDAPVDLAEVRNKLQKQVSPTLSAHGYAGYIVADKSRRILAATAQELIGQQSIPEYEAAFSTALKGNATVCPPFASVVMLKDETGRMRSGVPTMFVCAPVRDASFEVVGLLALRIRPELEFTRILQLGQEQSI
ncbi:MAG: cache domain-containing protein [Planctomycetota bacterium]|nr:cache domain-containing protein [Planctomycetota bacterium]